MKGRRGVLDHLDPDCRATATLSDWQSVSLPGTLEKEPRCAVRTSWCCDKRTQEAQTTTPESSAKAVRARVLLADEVP